MTRAAYLSQPGDRLYCAYMGCTGDLASEVNLPRHFAAHYPNELVSISRNGCPPKCSQCGLQVTLAQQMRGHVDTQQCDEGGEGVHHEAAAFGL